MNRSQPTSFPAAAPALDTKVPPQAWFLVSAVFHYLGPAFAVLLFPAVGVLGVAWFRIASAALVFAPITRPTRLFARIEWPERRLLVGMGACLALMNCCFYLALARLPISLVAAIEFVGTIGLALYGLRTPRNRVALSIAVAGVFILINVRWSRDLVGLGWAFANGALFVLYIVLGHRISRAGAGGGIERLGAAMAVAFIAVFPVGIVQAARAFSHPVLVLAGIGVGICSSVIPYACDQLAMARLSRSSFALMLTFAAGQCHHHRGNRLGPGSRASRDGRNCPGYGRDGAASAGGVALREMLIALILRSLILATKGVRMIARMWRGWAASTAAADLYEEFLRSSFLPAAFSIAGFKGASVLRRTVGDEVEFTTITRFESVQAIKQFAGEDYEAAHVASPCARVAFAI